MSELKKGKIVDVHYSCYEVELENGETVFLGREEILSQVILDEETIAKYRLYGDLSGLKECPFCNGLASLGDDPVSITCSCCDYSISTNCNDIDNFEACFEFILDQWNRRPIEDALTADNEALKAKVAELEEQQLENMQALIRLSVSIIDKNGRMEFNGDVSEYYEDSNLTSDLEDCETVDELVSALSELVFNFEQKEKNRSWDKLAEDMSNSYHNEKLTDENTRMREAIQSAMPFLQNAYDLTDGEEWRDICEAKDILNQSLKGGE